MVVQIVDKSAKRRQRPLDKRIADHAQFDLGQASCLRSLIGSVSSQIKLLPRRVVYVPVFQKVGAVAVEERRHLVVTSESFVCPFGAVAAILEENGVQAIENLSLVAVKVGNDFRQLCIEARLRKLIALTQKT